MQSWDTLQKFWIWGFCQNFLQKYYDSLKRDSIFGKAPQWFWAIITKFRCIQVIWFFGWFGSLNSVIWVTQMTQLTKYLVIWVTRITKFGDFWFFLDSFGSTRKFTKQEPARNCLPFDDWCFTMTQTMAAFATLLVPTPMVLLYIDSVMIKYMKELHYGVFNNQSCAKSDFLLSISAAQMKRVPIPFMVHKYFLLANFLVLIISHINMMLIVMFECPRRLAAQWWLFTK